MPIFSSASIPAFYTQQISSVFPASGCSGPRRRTVGDSDCRHREDRFREMVRCKPSDASTCSMRCWRLQETCGLEAQEFPRLANCDDAKMAGSFSGQLKV